jgi:hypothetical protein
MPGGAVGSVQYNLDGTNFGGFGDVDTIGNILTLTGYDIQATSFNNIVFTTSGSGLGCLLDNGAYGLPSGYSEINNKEIDLSVVANTNIVTNLGNAFNINIIFNQANQQFAIDFTPYSGSSDLVTASMYRRTVIKDGTNLYINDGWGDFSLTPSAQTVQYFVEDTDTSPDPTTPLGNDFIFANNANRDGSIWQLYCQLQDSGVTNPFVERFWINAVQTFGATNPLLFVDYKYKLVS